MAGVKLCSRGEQENRGERQRGAGLRAGVREDLPGKKVLERRREGGEGTGEADAWGKRSSKSNLKGEVPEAERGSVMTKAGEPQAAGASRGEDK